MATTIPQLIVVAEDEPDMAELMADRLRRHGYTSLIANNGLAALNAVFTRKPALVILDRMMPQMEGLEVCRLIKASPFGRSTAVLMVTAMASIENKLEGFDSGADDYLVKPFEMREHMARVNAMLSSSPVAD